LAVVSRFKKDTIKLKKKGGKRVSRVDPRVTFKTSKGQFAKKEKVVLQVTLTRSLARIVSAMNFSDCFSVLRIAVFNKVHEVTEN